MPFPGAAELADSRIFGAVADDFGARNGATAVEEDNKKRPRFRGLFE